MIDPTLDAPTLVTPRTVDLDRRAVGLLYALEVERLQGCWVLRIGPTGPAAWYWADWAGSEERRRLEGET